MTDRPMTADDFLRSVREARVEKRRCEIRLEELQAQCEKTTASYGPLAPGGGGDLHHDALLAAVSEQATELAKRRSKYIRQIAAVEDFISELPDVTLRTVLRLRYVDCLRWDSVASGLREYGLYYNERTMFKLHGKALGEARRLWGERQDGEDK